MINTERLWATFRNDGSVPIPGSEEFESVFGGTSVVVTRARALYEVLYPLVEGSLDKRVDYGSWGQLSGTTFRELHANQKDEKCLKNVLRLVPCLSFFVNNINIPAEAQVGAISHTIGGIGFDRICEAKLLLRKLHIHTWTRSRESDEQQGGHSVLGAISEKLLEEAFETLIDSTNLLRSTNTEIKTYGDFVLIALPNNLWFSVKSGYSRERLLASGYFNDVVGVGFFEKAKEFTSLAKVRNFKKVGFLAIYLPDTPVTELQVVNQTNTYDEVVSSYNENELPLPVNINQKRFFRKLSNLGSDVQELLNMEIGQRTTINF